MRYSIDNPFAYADSNLTGMLTVLEGCRHHGIQHLLYASSSSVYGMGDQMPYSTAQQVDHPVSLYAATKKSGELMAHAYSALYGLPTTGLRFFTVYGPWGRPDMAIIKFTRAILAGEPIDVYNHGDLSRDFTYIDDIVEGILAVADQPPRPNSDWHASEQSAAESAAPTASSISATANRCGCSILSRRWKRPSANPPSSGCCRCRQVTCTPPGPTANRYTPSPVCAPLRPSSKVLPSSSAGISTTIGPPADERG